MKTKTIKAMLIILFMIMSFGYGQENIRPGIIYQPGDTIFSPSYGITAIIPEGWAGVLPQETEMFLLMTREHPQSSIYAFGFNDTLEEMKARWETGGGLEVENNIRLTRSGEVYNRGEGVAADLVLENSTSGLKGYVETRCSEVHQKCLMLLMVVPEMFYEKAKVGLMDLMEHVEFNEPSRGSLYDHFDWSSFFDNKFLATRQVNPYEKSERNNQLWFCPDGSFKSNIRIKGYANIPKKISGKRSGTWKAEGTGPQGTLILNFSKYDEPISLPALIEDDKVFINDIRYFVMENNQCK